MLESQKMFRRFLWVDFRRVDALSSFSLTR